MIIQVFLHLSVQNQNHQLLVSPASQCITSLCCLVYPRRGPLRKLEAKTALPQNGCMVTTQPLALSDALPTERPSGDTEVVNIDEAERNADESAIAPVTAEPMKGCETTERSVDPFIDQFAIGPLTSRDTRMKVFEILRLVAASEIGRDGLRRLQVYEVLRLWHLIEKDDEIL